MAAPARSNRAWTIAFLVWVVIALLFTVPLLIGFITSDSNDSRRDWVLIVAGILWLILGLIPMAIAAALAFVTRRGMGAADRMVTKKLRPSLAQLHGRLAAARDFTSRLPGNTPLPEGEARPAARLPGIRNPFRRKKRRRWLPFPR